MLLNKTTHYTYCSNIHPGETWDETFKALKENVPAIKKELCPDQKFGLGLRLSNLASIQLNEGNNLQVFKEWCAEEDVYVFTMNGFPYGEFHQTIVKDKVHAPDWTSKERLLYTKRLFKQLAELIPSTIEGGISSSPLTYRHWHRPEDLEHIFEKSCLNLAEVVILLATLEKETGNYLHLDIEPEPDGLLENSDEFIAFYLEKLIPIASPFISDHLNIDEYEAKAMIYRYITMCYDVCHFALAFESPEQTLAKLEQRGIKIGKVQISAALSGKPEEGKETAFWTELEKLDESCYLHQVTCKMNGKLVTYRDIGDIIDNKPKVDEVRAHFHVPVFVENYENFSSTQNSIIKVMELQKELQFCNHFEVETYTWGVLPKEIKLDLKKSISRELLWGLQHLT